VDGVEVGRYCVIDNKDITIYGDDKCPLQKEIGED
jgi:hypothetical protein